MEAQLAYYSDSANVATAALSKQFSTLGSSREDLVALRDPGIHPRHVSLHWNASRATWDLTRLHHEGTVEVNGRSLGDSEAVPLSHLDEILVGKTRFRFHKQPAEPRRGAAPAGEIALTGSAVVLGRASANAQEEPGTVRIDLDADDSGISRVHALITPDADGTWYIEDRSKTGTELNGRAFTRKPLVFGDRFRIRDYYFEFTGTSIIRVDQVSGGRIVAEKVSVSVPAGESTRTILGGVSLEIGSGEFVGILGGSGTGKSTLLKALCGLMPVSEGSITVDGAEVATAAGNSGLGFVPQDDIVHHELTVRQALLFSARLKLKAPDSVLLSLVDGTIQRLGLQAQTHQRIGSLSGGQRKRVNIATELLTRPPVLLLDEPSSGLDPANEEELMTMLQNLCLTGQTVVCSTHVLHKAYLFDRIAFVHGGQLMFMGTPGEARRFFLDDADETGTGSAGSGHAPLEKIYSLFSQNTSHTQTWHDKFVHSAYAPGNQNEAPPPLRLVANRATAASRPGNLARLRILLARQWSILRSDRLNLIFLAAQAAVIGVLAAWVGRGEPEFRLFLAMIATLWFGCNNAAQQMTREVPVFRRERVSGLGISTYLHSKSLFLTACTVLQSLLLLVCMYAVLGLSSVTGFDPSFAHPGATGWLLHGASFLLISATGVGIGLSISATARSSTQAAIWVPLVLIPQILFAGFVVPLADMPASVRAVSHLVPSASGQRLLDVGNIIGREMPLVTHNTREPLFWETEFKDGKLQPRYLPEVPTGGPVKRKDIAEISRLSTSWQNLAVEHSQVGKIAPARPPEDPENEEVPIYIETRPDLRPGASGPLKAGETFTDLSAAWTSGVLLIAWLGATGFIIHLGLRRRDPLRSRGMLVR